MSDRFSLPSLLDDIGNLIGGLPGVAIRYAASLIRHHERFNARVAERIDQERRTMTAAGVAANHAARLARGQKP